MHPDRNSWNRQQNTVFSFFFSFSLLVNGLREHPVFSALVSSLFFGGRETDRRLVQVKKLRMSRKHKRHGTFAMSTNYETY